MKNNLNFAVFIPSHGRADNVVTYKSLRKQGYNGKIYIVVDDKDKQIDKYIDNYGDDVLVFSKKEASQYTDSYDSKPKMKSVLYARNAIFKLADGLDLDNFLVLDDDYTGFYHIYDSKMNFGHWRCSELDKMFLLMCEYLNSTDMTCIAFAQGGDFAGGSQNDFPFTPNRKRKVMNSFFCSTKKPFQYYGEMNDDVNTYIRLGNKGHIFLTIPRAIVVQKETQKNAGGLTDMYLERGTYVKSFHSVITMPSSVKIMQMGVTDMRLHHRINRDLTVPKILNEKYGISQNNKTK